jgi:sugar phosphate isomerase/epimerase
MEVSFQLYSARNFTPWADVFATLANAGYTQVEGFGPLYQDPAATRDMLDANGLTMPSGHFFPLGTSESDFDAAISTAKTLGINRLFCPAPEEAIRTGGRPEWEAFASRLDMAAKRIQDAGLRFGYHNHHWEFTALDDGTLPFQILLDQAPTMEWEIDVAWVVRGGADPLAWITSQSHRISAAHIKDIAPEGECADEDGWADVGHGTMDWPALTRALRDTGCDLFVMEHDNPSDGTRFATRSITNFKTY